MVASGTGITIVVVPEILNGKAVAQNGSAIKGRQKGSKRVANTCWVITVIISESLPMKRL
jgi:hypothetical protein